MVEKDTKTHAARRIALDPDTVGDARRAAANPDWRSRAAATGSEVSTEEAHVFSPDLGWRLVPSLPYDVTKTLHPGA